MPPINRISVDSSGATTDLCRLGAQFGTDKSPYSTTWHHHAYTAVYDMLFAPRRYSPITFGELGILDNSSMRMWRSYFTQATLHGFEFDQARIAAARAQRIPNTHYHLADVSSSASLFDAFSSAGRLFDVLIDDSTHQFEHQLTFAATAIDFVKPGGMIVIEDVFRPWDEADYASRLSGLMPYVSSALFVETNHAQAYSGGSTVVPYYDNDKLLVLHRNERVREHIVPA